MTVLHMPGTMLSALETSFIFLSSVSSIMLYFFMKKTQIKYGKMLRFDDIELWEGRCLLSSPFFSFYI